MTSPCLCCGCVPNVRRCYSGGYRILCRSVPRFRLPHRQRRTHLSAGATNCSLGEGKRTAATENQRQAETITSLVKLESRRFPNTVFPNRFSPVTQNRIFFRLRNDLYCVGWGVKLYSFTHSKSHPNVGSLPPSSPKSPTNNIFFPKNAYLGSFWLHAQLNETNGKL